ncbi:divergent polysaccharide deacetylase family protein [Pelagibacterium luteolum]|uniref:Divergent polysaccharide deacetylase n=1 Tax=Pelagibacterium luteolum TaxID=440168 RepID=A0A1G7S9A7_9HYPH|nr:divergent polysaccharide deacetylase family protein [Pelagibacterium luteolum]SDG19616.1 hypothetical protein SAMN04487974_101377 [Pelagibacterium luteolum]
MTDDLNAPLGRGRRKADRQRLNLPWGRIGGTAVLAFALGIGAWILFVDDPLGGRPVAEVAVNTQSIPNPIIEDVAPTPIEPAIVPIDAPNGPSIITLGANAPVDSAGEDLGPQQTLIEMTEDGPLPRIASDGTRPHQAYARPSVSIESAGGRKLIAIVVTGLGLNDSSTRQAIDTLPGTVTLAFAPYGQSLMQLAGTARADGHEIMLEVPLEPFDYPQNDPGPHTLLVEQPPRENLEKLHWLMSRMEGYTGIINHMGARFTASAADFSPIMEELGLRGLSYLDDGSSNRSVAPQLAQQNGVPFARALSHLDDNPSGPAITQQLEVLKAAADQNGHAIGLLSALPVSIRTLAEWADALDQDSYLLVPVSVLTNIQG